MPEFPPLVTGQAGQGLFVTPVKKLVIRALRATFTSLYPDTKMAGMNIDMEYPHLEEEYPGIWVRFSPDKIQASGLDYTQTTDSEIFGVWHFEGTVSLLILALTSKERDLIADGFVEAFAFGALMPSASVFYSTMLSSDLVNMTPQSDILTAGGQTESVGTPWDDDKLCYQDSYSFRVIGQFRSRVQDVEFVNLSEIQTSSTLINVTGAPDNSIPDDGNGTWQ